MKDFYIEIWEHEYGDGRKQYKAQVGRRRKWWFDKTWYVWQSKKDFHVLRDLTLNECYPYDTLDEAKAAAESAIDWYVKKNLANKLVQVRKVYP